MMPKSIVVGGAYAISKYGVLPVFGEAIQLKPNEHDIEEMAMVVNLNFHTWSSPPVFKHEDLPGPSAV